MKQSVTSPHGGTSSPTSATSGVWYVYGVVPADFHARHAATGLEDTQVTVERASVQGAAVAALVSTLDAAEYSPEPLEKHTADVNWLAPRAAAHDRVLTWASDRGAVVPFPMFSVFSGPAALQAMLRERGQELARVLEHVAAGREYGVRVYRLDAELLGAITQLSPRLAELERAANDATPGQRYLLQRKLETSKRDEMRAVGRAVADDLWTRLQEHAVESVRLAIPRVAASDAEGRSAGTMVLNASFLIAPDALPDLQRELTAFAGDHDTRGFRLDFTGPWPPYHFVGAETGGDAGTDEARRGG